MSRPDRTLMLQRIQWTIELITRPEALANDEKAIAVLSWLGAMADFARETLPESTDTAH